MNEPLLLIPYIYTKKRSFQQHLQPPPAPPSPLPLPLPIYMSRQGAAALAAGTSGFDPTEEEEAAAEDQYLVREQDRLMPIANVTRIMKKILPAHAKISSDAKETIQECVSEYISFITSEANYRCRNEGRKTVTAMDVIWAMSKAGFDDYVQPLMLYLHRYRELEGECSATRADDQMLHLVPLPHHPATEDLSHSTTTATSATMKTSSDAGSSSQPG